MAALDFLHRVNKIYNFKREYQRADKINEIIFSKSLLSKKIVRNKIGNTSRLEYDAMWFLNAIVYRSGFSQPMWCDGFEKFRVTRLGHNSFKIQGSTYLGPAKTASIDRPRIFFGRFNVRNEGAGFKHYRIEIFDKENVVVYKKRSNKLLKYTPATKSVASAGNTTRCSVFPLAKR